MATIKFVRDGSITWHDGATRYYIERIRPGQQMFAKVDKALDRYVLCRSNYIAIVPTNVLEIC